MWKFASFRSFCDKTIWKNGEMSWVLCTGGKPCTVKWDRSKPYARAAAFWNLCRVFFFSSAAENKIWQIVLCHVQTETCFSKWKTVFFPYWRLHLKTICGACALFLLFSINARFVQADSFHATPFLSPVCVKRIDLKIEWIVDAWLEVVRVF